MTLGDKKKRRTATLSSLGARLRGSTVGFTEAIKTPNDHELRLLIRLFSNIHTVLRQGI